METDDHHYKYPTIVKWELIRSSKHSGIRDGILSNPGDRKMVEGGIHLTRGAYLPTTIIKEFSASEEDFFTGSVNLNFLLTATSEELDQEQRRVYQGFYRSFEESFLG